MLLIHSGLRHLAVILLLFSRGIATAAESARPAYVPPPVVETSGMIKVTLSLLLVLAAIMAIAWVFKRFNLAQQGRGDLLKVIGSVAIGQRERVVLLEVGDTWLLVGVGPGQIRTLHTLEKEPQSDTQPQPVADHKFGALLGTMLKQRQTTGKKDVS